MLKNQVPLQKLGEQQTFTVKNATKQPNQV
jgi:hypothetical protein